jgi:hypothetical protein
VANISRYGLNVKLFVFAFSYLNIAVFKHAKNSIKSEIIALEYLTGSSGFSKN